MPYGYRIIDGKPVIHHEEADRIRILFKEFLRLKSMRGAAKIAGIVKTHSSIGRIISSTVYINDAFYPSILDEKVFMEAQKIRRRNAEVQNRGKRSEEPVSRVRTVYRLNKIPETFKDPFRQAEYVYNSIVEEDVDE